VSAASSRRWRIGSLRLSRRRLTELDTRTLRATWTSFRPSLRGLGPTMALAGVLSLGVTVLELLRPWPITWVVDHLVGAVDPTQVSVRPILVFAAIAFAVPALGGVVDARLQLAVARISRKATVRIRADVFEHIQRLEYPRHDRHFTGDLLIRLMGDVNMVRDLLFSSWLTLASRGMLLIGSAVVFAFVDWRLLLLALLPLPLLSLDMRRTSSAVRTASSRSRKKEGAIASAAAESIRHVGLVKAFAAEDRATHRFRAQARSAERATMAAATQSAHLALRTEILTGAGVAMVLAFGAMRVRDGALTPGELVLAIGYTRSLYKPLRKISDEAARLGKAMACAGRLRDLLDQPTEDQVHGRPAGSLRGDLELVDIHHRYSDGRETLRGVSAQVPGGSLVAVTGENGTGKSTMLSLLLRLDRPSRGEITIGGVPIDEYQLSSYRDQVAFVPQQLALFAGTIRENIAFGRPDASGAEILAAAEAALLLPVIDRLPNGLDTMLTEAGGSLSGGEARRVMLARAAIRRSSVLLLDEPLVGLDPDARPLVIRAIRNIALGRTTLVVHHGELDELAPDVHLHLERDRAVVRTASPTWAAAIWAPPSSEAESLSVGGPS
jgi:ATP-binding cassette subfamily B protein